MIDGKAVIVAEQDALKDAIADLLTPPDASPPTAVLGGDRLLAAGTAGGGDFALLLAAPATSATLPDLAMWRSAQKNVAFPLQAPRFIPEGFSYVSKMPARDGTYDITVGDETRPAVRMIYRRGNSDDYLGITATTWTDAPLASKGKEVAHDGVVYTVVGTSGKVDHIWWKKDDVLYFISNTLMYTVGRDDLLAMAESMTPVSGGQ
jgi:hypothetical protein